MKLTKSQTKKINEIINNFNKIESNNFIPEIINQSILPKGQVIFTFKKKVIEQYKNTALVLLQKSWCIIIGKNGCVKYVNEKGKIEIAKDLYFI